MSDFATIVSASLDRIIAMQLLAVPSVSAAYPYIYVEGTPPYFSTYISALTQQVISGDDEGLALLSATYQMRLVLGTGTQGYDGQLQEQAVRAYIPDTISYFWTHKRLIYQAGQAALDALQPDYTVVGNSAGMRLTPDGLLFIEIPLSVSYLMMLAQAY